MTIENRFVAGDVNARAELTYTLINMRLRRPILISRAPRRLLLALLTLDRS